MTLSVFDLFTVGIGPSSSHTVGPMRAAALFLIDEIPEHLPRVSRIECHLYGSLGATGRGHATDTAVILGLLGEKPDTVQPGKVQDLVDEVTTNHTLVVGKRHSIRFDPDTDIVLDGLTTLPGHPNGMTLEAFDDAGASLAKQIYYSVGGGFVVVGDVSPSEPIADDVAVPYPFNTAQELLDICERTGMSIAQVTMENEKCWHSEEDVKAKLLEIWAVMKECVANGISATDARLPGTLGVPRRAPGLHKKLVDEPMDDDPLRGMDWLTLYALAVNEENAAGGRIVTAPTNGAAGIIPSVLHYYKNFVEDSTEDGVIDFLLTAAAVGMIVKANASVSGAEVGCQGEVGSASSMAAAGFTAAVGGTPAQVENAAEIAMEHNLGLTCDPIGGLVQIPCIERNAVASVKAVTASRTALHGDGTHLVSLDSVIETMRETGRDMMSKYKETSMGGLAIHARVPVSIIEC